jgi:pimeloyl-ACP methyl ester carboxylesterase
VQEITDHAGEVYGMPAFWRTAPTPVEGVAPTLWVHGVPTSSDDWIPFLQLAGGIAPDLPGFGRSSKRGDLAYDIDWYCEWLDAFIEKLGVERVRLCVHDWGGLALAWAARRPERIERIVVIDSVPLLPGYKWHRLARAWRTPFVGEMVMGMTFKWSLRLISRESNATPGPLPKELIDAAHSHFDQGTQRAILRLYRSAPPEVLAEKGRSLGLLDCPSLVIWGEQDPYIPANFADSYAAALGDATAERIDGAGHWPWLDRPELVERIGSFLTATD